MKAILFFLRHSRHLRRTRLTLCAIIVLGSLGGLCTTALLATVNNALRAESDWMGGLLLRFVVLLVVAPLSGFAARVLASRLASDVVQRLRENLSRSLLAAPLRRLEDAGTGPLLAVLGQDIPAISTAFVSFSNLILNATIFVSCLVYLGFLSWQALLLVLGALVPVAIVYRLLGRRANRQQELGRDAQESLYHQLRSFVDGQKELKLNARRGAAFLDQVLRVTGEEAARRLVAFQTFYSGAGSWGQMMFFVMIGLALFLLPVYRSVDLRTLTGYTLTIVYMLIPTEAILNILPQMTQAKVALEKIESLGLSLNDPSATAVAGGAPEFPLRHLELADVTTSYSQDTEEAFRLGPVGLDVPAGQLVFLTGGNGSGKTTLAKLLVGLYPPETGEIRLNGLPVHQPEEDSYRSHFSTVFSDFFLFGNLLGLDHPRLDERALEYLRLLQLDEKVKVSDGSLSTLSLSQGERKRLALLTAYLEDRSVYLFDEWAADQDPEFKRIFYRRLLPDLKARGKTVFVISHDERFYDVADRIVKLDYGKVDSPIALS